MSSVFIVEYDPYATPASVRRIIGPFVSHEAAEEWKKSALECGAHPDSEWEIHEPYHPGTRLSEIQKEAEDGEDDT